MIRYMAALLETVVWVSCGLGASIMIANGLDGALTPPGSQYSLEAAATTDQPISWEPILRESGGAVVTLPAALGHPDVSIISWPNVVVEVSTPVGDDQDGGAVYIFAVNAVDLPKVCMLRVGHIDYLIEGPAFSRSKLSVFRYWW